MLKYNFRKQPNVKWVFLYYPKQLTVNLIRLLLVFDGINPFHMAT